MLNPSTIDDEMESEINTTIMKRTVDAMKSEGADYGGVLYGGLMIMEENRPYVIEFNAALVIRTNPSSSR